MILTPYRKYQYEEIKTNPQTKTPTTPRWEKPLTRASICQYGSGCSFISNRAVDTNNLLNRTAPPPANVDAGGWIFGGKFTYHTCIQCPRSK